jgi:redox-sensitive bicupin YhaK (pirin superfamily)
LLFLSGKPLHEPIAWGGPIVMNTQKQLDHAFQELETGTFIKQSKTVKPSTEFYTQ